MISFGIVPRSTRKGAWSPSRDGHHLHLNAYGEGEKILNPPKIISSKVKHAKVREEIDTTIFGLVLWSEKKIFVGKKDILGFNKSDNFNPYIIAIRPG